MKAKIYVAGPYSKGNTARNVRNAFETADELADRGYAPFVPHYTHFWEMLFPREYEFWLDLDSEFLPCCDALYRIPGESVGADKEIKQAKSIGIPVFHKIEALDNHFN